jgi:O-antigen ligase
VLKWLLLLLFFALMGSRALGLETGLGPGLSIKNALLYAAATLIAAEAAVARNRRLELLPLLLPFAVLIVYAAMSWLAMVVFVEPPGYDAGETLVRWKTKLVDQFITLLVFYYGVVNREDALWLMKRLLWVVVLGCVITVVDSYNIPDLGIVTAREDDGRIEGIIGAAAEFGGLLAFFIPSVIALSIASAGKARLLAILGVGAAFMSVLLSASRGAMVALAAGAVVAAFYLRRQITAQMMIRTAFATLCVMAIAVAAVAYSEFGALLSERLTTGLETGSAESVSSGRTAIWTTAVKEMLDAPISFVSGLGWETYFQTSGRRLATHNVYLDRLYNLGSIGLVLFLLPYVFAVTTLRRGIESAEPQFRPYLIATVIGLSSFVIAMVFTDLQGAATYMWAYVGAALRVATPRDEKLASETGAHANNRRNLPQANPATRPMSATPKR